MSFFFFPMNKASLNKAWICATRRKKFVPSRSSALCEKHFKPEDFSSVGKRKRLKSTAIPSIFAFPKHLKSTSKKLRATKNSSGSIPPPSAPSPPSEELSLTEKVNLSSGYVGSPGFYTCARARPFFTRSSNSKPGSNLKRSSACDDSLALSSADPLEVSSTDPLNISQASSSPASVSSCNAKPQPEAMASFDNKPSQQFGCQEKKRFKAMPSSSTLPASFHSYTSKQLESPTKFKRKIATLQKKVRRQENKMSKMSEAISQLEEKNMISESGSNVLREKFSGLSLSLFENEMANEGRSKYAQHYSEEIKKFALTLHFYSPRGYNFLRDQLHLPSPRSLQRWTSSVNCTPGFFLDVFKELGQRASKDLKYKDCALIFDGMHIKSRSFYIKNKGCYEGFVDFGQDLDIQTENDTMATEALVFLLVGMKARWKYPCGYFLINKIDASIQSRLVEIALDLGFENGLNIHTITADGTNVNPATMTKLGVKYLGDPSELDGKLDSKHTHGKDIFFIMDTCHMVKLAMNALAYLGTFYDESGQPIKWAHITRLLEVQKNEGLNFANKLGQRHISFEKHKMKVNLAAQCLSQSVGDAIGFLKDCKVEGFQDSAGTIQFIYQINRLFDMLNSRAGHAPGFKKPLSLFWMSEWKQELLSAIEYLVGLKGPNGLPLHEHRRKTFVRGFILTAKSTISVANELLTREEDPFSFVLTYKMSQDHIELLFGCIRGKNGYNNNPDVVQFRSSLKSISVKNSIQASKSGNCLEFESGYSIFDLKQRKNSSPAVEPEAPDQHDHDLSQLCHQIQSKTLSDFQDAIVGYIAGYIVRKLQAKIAYEICHEALKLNAGSLDHGFGGAHVNLALRLISKKQRGGLIVPAPPVIELVRNCEKSFRILVCGDQSDKLPNAKNLKLKLYSLVMKYNKDVVFSSLLGHDMENSNDEMDLHSTQLKKKICETFLNVRLITYGQRYYKEILQKPESLGKRQQLNKLVLFQSL